MFVTRKTQGRRWPCFSLGINEKNRPHALYRQTLWHFEKKYCLRKVCVCRVAEPPLVQSYNMCQGKMYLCLYVHSAPWGFNDTGFWVRLGPSATSPLVVITFLCPGRYTPHKDTPLLFCEHAVGCLSELDVHGSVYHSIIHTEIANKMQQCIKIYYSMFIWSSTCFRRHTAHHQELKTALVASGFAEVAGRCQRPAISTSTTFHVCKTRGC